VAALLLVDSGPGFKKPEAQAAWQASVERTASFIEAQGLEAFAARAADLTVGAHPESPAARAALRAIAAQRPHGLAHFGRRIAALAPPVIDELPRIEAPALVLVGERDLAYQRAAEVMAARLPHAKTATIPRAGHMVNLDEPAAFETAVLAFLHEVRAAAA
jgi:pimeloyl-ACP methyl ester carboxylesterase